MTPISLRGVGKEFKKVTLRKQYRTLKSLFLGKLKGPGTEQKPNNIFKALQDITIDFPKGETWGLVGRNGSGKSTLLKLIAGIYRPDHGEIIIDGRVSALIELGAGFHPDFSGRENIFINASILGFSKKKIIQHFDEIVAFAELEDFIDNPVRTYSSGMFMRLGFSIAVHVNPDILLIDEVLAVGDEAFGHKCQEKMESFKKAGKTMLLVSHNLSEIEKWCDGAVWLDKGRIMESGKPNRVIDAYLATVAETENAALVEGKERVEGEGTSKEANRWGTREVEITNVSMIDESGNERYVYSTGASIAMEIEYKANKTVLEPIFGIAIHKQDGALCYGSNTDIENIQIEKVEGDGKVTVSFDKLDLVEGAYSLSVAVHAEDGYAYDFHDQMYEFSIRSKIKDSGVFRPSHTWSINGAGKL